MSQPEATTAEQLRHRFRAYLAERDDERKDTQCTLELLTESGRYALEALCEQARFEIPFYGPGRFYVWPVHELFRRWPVDPWPAARYPKYNLTLELAHCDDRWRSHETRQSTSEGVIDDCRGSLLFKQRWV